MPKPNPVPTLPEGDCWMTPQQVAEYVGISRDALERRRRAKEPPRFSKLGHRTVRYRRSDVDRWLQSLFVEPEGE